MKSEISQETKHQSNKIDLAYKTSLAVACVVFLVYGLQSFYPSIIGPLSRGMMALFAGAASFSAVLGASKYGFKISERFGRVWLCFALGMISWFVGETLWVVYNVILNVQIPYP